MKQLVIVFILFASAVGSAAVRKQLFNGKDLDGWARIPRHEDAPADHMLFAYDRDGLLLRFEIRDAGRLLPQEALVSLEYHCDIASHH